MDKSLNELAQTALLSKREQFDRNYDLGARSDPRYWGNYIDTSNVSGLQEQAYVNKDGLAIRVNPNTGYKELFIAGTRSPLEWVQNVVEGIGITVQENAQLLDAVGGAQKAKLAYEAKYASAADPFGTLALSGVKNISGISIDARDDWADYIDQLVETEGIEVVYGHSRGSAIMSAMDSDVKYISLDGAMIIAHPKADFLNLQSGLGGVDLALAPTYKNNLVLHGRAFHNVARPVLSRKKKKMKATKSSVLRKKQRSKTKKDRSRHQKFSDRIKVIDKLLGRKRPRDQKSIMEKAIKKQKVKEELTLFKKRNKKRPPKKKKKKSSKHGRPFQR